MLSAVLLYKRAPSLLDDLTSSTRARRQSERASWLLAIAVVRVKAQGGVEAGRRSNRRIFRSHSIWGRGPSVCLVFLLTILGEGPQSRPPGCQ